MEQEYFDFLLSFLDEGDEELPSIFDSHHLLWKLHHIEFRYSAMMDRNRDMDGREWRNRYGGKLSPAFRKSPASVLEVLLGLADRIAFELDDEEGLDPYFWEMIENLGINYADYQFDNSGNALDRKVDKTVQRWMSRQYDSHGRGGIFPLESVPEFYESDEFQNQNRLELWYQMQLYLAENYDI
nr:MAG TPA: hypothetical protein [Siphovirus LN-2020-2]